MKYGNRPLWKKVMSSPVVLLVLLIVCVFLAKATRNLHIKAQTSEARLAQVHMELAKLENRETELSEKVAKLSTSEGLETEIRSKYRAVKEGESLAVIIDDDRISATNTASSTSSEGWFKRLLHKVGL